MRIGVCLALLFAEVFTAGFLAQGQQSVVLERGNSTIVLEPYAPNILRVTLSLQKENATAGPGYGFVGTPSADGWSRTETDTSDVYSSPRMVVTIGGRPGGVHKPWKPVPSQVDIGKFFSGSTPGATSASAPPTVRSCWRCRMADVGAQLQRRQRRNLERPAADDPFYQVGATFASPEDEHYYGLGQNQEGYLDRRGHTVRCCARLQRSGWTQRLRAVCGHQ